MKDGTRGKTGALILAVCLLLGGSVFADQLRMVNNLRNENVLVPMSAPNRDDLSFLKYAIVTDPARTVS